MLTLKNIHKTYQTDKIETIALNDISIQIEKGEFIAVMGPSGCGKSTLLNIMGLLDVPSSGRVFLSGNPIESYKDREVARIRNERVGFIFQSFHLIPDLRVLDNVELPMLYRKVSAKQRRILASEALEKVGLQARMDHFPSQLSGGQQQRVAIARAIVGNPELLLADEPTGNLDSHMGEEIMQILERLHREEQTSIVMVTHDEQLARRTGRILRMHDGHLIGVAA